MSDSDETDILLLIPPNFFSTPTKKESRRISQFLNIKSHRLLDSEYIDNFEMQPLQNVPFESCNANKSNREESYKVIGNNSQKYTLDDCNAIDCNKNCYQNEILGRCSYIQSAIDGDSAQNVSGPLKKCTCTSSKLEEESLRRKQCERTIHSLEQQIQQFQDKYADVIKMDQTKNDAMSRLHSTNSSLVASINDLGKQLSEKEIQFHREKEKLNEENQRLKRRLHQMQTHNSELEEKMFSLLKTTDEVSGMHQKQLDELNTRLQHAEANERCLAGRINKLQTELSIERTKLTEEELKLAEAKEEVRQLTNTVSSLRAAEVNIKKDFELQRNALKKFYQEQLDTLVRDKVNEYQSQLDSIVETIRKESKQNELQFIQKALAQIHLINQKNEQEFDLQQEKHREEMELSRIKLTNANKTIEQLERELCVYRIK